MKSMDLLETIGSIRETYIQEAGAIRERTPPAEKQKFFRLPSRKIAAMIALALASILFLQTPLGAAAVEIAKESLSRLIETLFPPRDLIVLPEGTPEVIPHEAQGRNPQEDVPGFVLYVDTESYTMTEENGTYYIRQNPTPYDRETIREQQAALLDGLSPEEQEAAIDQRIQELKDAYASLPANEIQIREISGKEAFTYAQEVRNQIAPNWVITRDILWGDKPLGYKFSISGGTRWDSLQEDHYFVDNGQEGTFHIAARYYLEAAEDIGARFTSMIQTFTVVTDENTTPYCGKTEDLVEIMCRKVESAAAENESLSAQQDPANQDSLKEIAKQRYQLWLETLDSLWTALEFTQDAATMEDLLISQVEWSLWKSAKQDQAAADAGDDTLSAAVFYEEGASLLEQRVTYLLNVLQGTTSVPPSDLSAPFSPEAVVSKFMHAYFSGDKNAVMSFLSQSYPWDWGVEVYPDFEMSDPEINAIKGLDHLVYDLADRGVVRPSVEFRKTPDSDYYIYLSMSLTWEGDRWMVSEYYLES